MQSMRLAMLSRRFWPGMGSAETILAQLACGLADRGCQVTIVTGRRFANWPAKIDFHGFPVFRVGPTPQGFWRRRQATAAIDTWLRQHIDEFDLVYVLGMEVDAAAAVRAMGGRRPVVLAPLRSGRHGDCCWQVANFGRRAVKNACLKADAFLAYSPAVRRELEAAGYPRDKIRDACLGIGPAGASSSKTRSQARGDLGEENGPLFLAPNTQLAICTTRLHADSGWQSLIDAWPMVMQARPAARLWFVSEPACRKEVLDRISALGLDGQVQVIGAMDSLEAIVAAADLLVAPSPHGSHVAILEAMAAGLPVVAADTSVNRWLLNVSGTLRVPPEIGTRSVPDTLAAGIVVPPGDAKTMADVIITLLNSPELAEELGTAAWQKTSRDFSLAKMLDDHLTLFEGMLAAPLSQTPL